MTWYEFTFEAPHPEDRDICLQFFIQIPLPPARDLPKGSVLESHIRWREDPHE